MTYSEETQEFPRCDQCGKKGPLALISGLLLCRGCEAAELVSVDKLQDLRGTRL